MKAGLEEGDLWPLAKGERAMFEQVPLPWERVERHLARLHPEERAKTMARLASAGLVPPCAVKPSVLFDLSKSKPLSEGVVGMALKGWRRLTVAEQMEQAAQACRALESA